MCPLVTQRQSSWSYIKTVYMHTPARTHTYIHGYTHTHTHTYTHTHTHTHIGLMRTSDRAHEYFWYGSWVLLIWLMRTSDRAHVTCTSDRAHEYFWYGSWVLLIVLWYIFDIHMYISSCDINYTRMLSTEIYRHMYSYIHVFICPCIYMSMHFYILHSAS